LLFCGTGLPDKAKLSFMGASIVEVK
jgi:hypothetical protein